jgi:hypothetical protein
MHRTLVAANSMWLLMASVPVLAQPIIDGTRDAEYGPARAVQTVETQFGDNFSEMDAAYALCGDGRLSLMLTGNVEANFNRLDIFIDSKAGGQTVFDSAGNDFANLMDGLVFDSPFRADYHVIFSRGTDGVNPEVNLEFASLQAQAASGYMDIMSGGGLEGQGSTGAGVNASPILVGYDNSNVAGVGGGAGAANAAAAAAVTTGLELGIALTDLGYTATRRLRVMVGQNNTDHNYWSNQFLAGLAAPQGNLGGDGMGGFTGEGAIDFTLFTGDQFFVACWAELFHDGFESGSTSAWSAAVP